MQEVTVRGPVASRAPRANTAMLVAVGEVRTGLKLAKSITKLDTVVISWLSHLG